MTVERETNKRRKRSRPKQRGFLGFSFPFIASVFAIVDAVFATVSRCTSDNRTIGYSDFRTLRKDILKRENETKVNSTYVLCPFTLFEVGEPIVIPSNNLQLKCGHTGESSLGCVFDGGSTQFVIDKKSPTGIVIQGLTFRRANVTTVFISQNVTSSITFRDCRWENNFGPSTLRITNSVQMTQSRHRMRNRRGTFREFTVVIQECLFEKNQDVQSVLLHEAEGSLLAVHGTTFRENSAQENIILVKAGSLSLTDTTFLANEFDGISGEIMLGVKATLRNNTNNCANNTSISASCQGVSSTTCEAFDSSISCPIDTDVCYSNWTLLSRAVQAPTDTREFVICAGSLLDLTNADPGDYPIVIRESSTTMKCGKTGSRADNCTILGGQDQVLIQGNVTDIRFKGIIFAQSTRVSIGALGTSGAVAWFDDCAWSVSRITYIPQMQPWTVSHNASFPFRATSD